MGSPQCEERYCEYFQLDVNQNAMNGDSASYDLQGIRNRHYQHLHKAGHADGHHKLPPDDSRGLLPSSQGKDHYTHGLYQEEEYCPSRDRPSPARNEFSYREASEELPSCRHQGERLPLPHSQPADMASCAFMYASEQCEYQRYECNGNKGSLDISGSVQPAEPQEPHCLRQRPPLDTTNYAEKSACALSERGDLYESRPQPHMLRLSELPSCARLCEQTSTFDGRDRGYICPAGSGATLPPEEASACMMRLSEQGASRAVEEEGGACAMAAMQGEDCFAAEDDQNPYHPYGLRHPQIAGDFVPDQLAASHNNQVAGFYI